jgi:CBS domain-containing protein
MKEKRGVHEEHKRSALKTVSWRVIATTTGMLLIYFYTRRLELTAGFGVADVVLKMIFYFLHERGWDRISFGRSLHGDAKSVMRTPPIMGLSSDTVSSVIQKMLQSDIGSVIIVDGENPIGLITEGDIVKRILDTKKITAEALAGKIMSSPVTSVEQNMPLIEMLKLMREKKVRRLAVTFKGKLTGIITERRILEALTY